MGYSVPRKIECHSACGLVPFYLCSGHYIYPIEHAHSCSLSNPYLLWERWQFYLVCSKIYVTGICCNASVFCKSLIQKQLKPSQFNKLDIKGMNLQYYVAVRCEH